MFIFVNYCVDVVHRFIDPRGERSERTHGRGPLLRRDAGG